ncbi:hypothetical protein P7C70_g3402, partial [Phenoliferia sp. Uapishka_3]
MSLKDASDILNFFYKSIDIHKSVSTTQHNKLNVTVKYIQSLLDDSDDHSSPYYRDLRSRLIAAESRLRHLAVEAPPTEEDSDDPDDVDLDSALYLPSIPPVPSLPRPTTLASLPAIPFYSPSSASDSPSSSTPPPAFPL